MKEYKLQFEPADITRKLRQVYEFKGEKKKSFLKIESHAMISPLEEFIVEGSILYDSREGRERVLQNPIQKAYVQNLFQLSRVLVNCSHELMKKIQKKRFPRKSIDEMAKEYYESLSYLTSYLPVSERLQEIDKLNEEQSKLALRLDVDGKILVYATNRLFAPEFQRESYHLDEDINSFFIETEEILGQEGIELIYGKVEPIETQEDYILYAVSPLVWNAREHAFNPENDICGRMKKEKFWKSVSVFGFPEDDKKESGNYIVRVQDNGFGIQDDVLPHLFSKSGTGLCGVKDFVERNGGTIDVKTELGKGTTFEFTIPYSHKEDFVYIQASAPNEK